MRKRWLATSSLLLVAVIGVTATCLWYRSAGYVSTDDAEVDSFIMPVRARLSGTVASVPVTDNQRVRKGALLMQLRTTEFEREVAQARAHYRALQIAAGKAGSPGRVDSEARAAVANGKSSAALVDQLRVQLNNARADYQRVERLARDDLVSVRQRDAARTAMESLAYKLAAAQSQVNAANADIAAHTAEVKVQDFRVAAAGAALDLAKIRLADTRLRTPRDAIIAHKDVEPGQYVVTGQRLMSLVFVDDLWIIARFKETDIGHIRVGQPAAVVVDAYPGQKIRGVVQSIEPATTAVFSLLPAENATGNFTKVVRRIPVRIRLDSPASGLRLRPGMSVYVRVDVRAGSGP